MFLGSFLKEKGLHLQVLFSCLIMSESLSQRRNIGHRQKKKLPRFVFLLLWPGEVRRKWKGDSGRTGPALFAGSNNQSWVNLFFLPMPYTSLPARKKCSLNDSSVFEFFKLAKIGGFAAIFACSGSHSDRL